MQELDPAQAGFFCVYSGPGMSGRQRQRTLVMM